MLQTREIFHVSVTLKNGSAMNCTLLSKPTPSTLAAVAAAQGQSEDFAKVLAVSDEVTIPAIREGAEVTDVTIAGVLLGAINVETTEGYEVPEKKTRKPRQPADSSAPSAPTGKKRGRKPKNQAENQAENQADAPTDTPASID